MVKERLLHPTRCLVLDVAQTLDRLIFALLCAGRIWTASESIYGLLDGRSPATCETSSVNHLFSPAMQYELGQDSYAHVAH